MSGQINFHQLIDLACGSPEQDGVLNVKYLQALMHGLVHMLEVDNVRIELKGGQFSRADDLIDALEPKAKIEVVEYETQKNCTTGNFDKKKQRCKKQKVCVDTVMVLKDVNPTCPPRKKSKCPNNTNKDHKIRNCQKDIINIDYCLEHVLQKMETTKPCYGRSDQEPESQSSTHSFCDPCTNSSSTTISQSLCQSSDIISDVDTRLLSCIHQITTEIEQIKCQLRKTQTCLTRISENSKQQAETTEETDMKFDEVMKLFDDYEKRISRNCADVCACQKQIEHNVERIEAIDDEVETLFKKKGDKEEIAECLAKKANACELELKVDTDAFNHVKSELSESILDTKYQLKALSNELEARVKQICQCLNTKIDREAFSSFARCVEDRIKQIAHDTKQWINIKKKEVCPFTTYPFTQNMQCGACNQSVVMKGVEGNIPQLPPFSQITWNCHTKSLTCQRTGGRHTVTTAQDRCPKQSQFYEHFKGPSFDLQLECKQKHTELDFPTRCYETVNDQPSEEKIE